MFIQHFSSLQFLTYAAFFSVIVAALFKFVPGRRPPVRTTSYPRGELHAHDRKVAKYFVAGGFFLVLGSVHMAIKNVPWVAEWLARAGHAGHLVRDLSNTHMMIVGGGTLLATGLCWYILPRVVGRPLASDGLAQCAFWFTVVGLIVFYIALIANGIAMAHWTEQGWGYEYAKYRMGKWYKVPVGMGAGVMGLGYWCFATNVVVTIFQSRLVQIPKPQRHLWKFFATGAAALTVGTVQGVIQVQPDNAYWLFRAGHAGEWIDPISHAHVNLVTGLTMLVAGAAFYLLPGLGGRAPDRRLANACFYSLFVGSLAFYSTCLYLGFHEGRLVVDRGLTPEEAEQATRLHPFLIMTSGVLMLEAFWLLLYTLFRSSRGLAPRTRTFVLAGCGALAVGTLQGPLQALPLVNEALDRGGDAGDVIVNLHAQLNMLGGLMVLLMGLVLGALLRLGSSWDERRARRAVVCVPAGIGIYYLSGIAFSALEAHRVAGGQSFAQAVTALEPWQALAMVTAAAAVLVGFAGFAAAAWSMTARPRAQARAALAATPGIFAGTIPKRVRRRSPAALAGYELPLGLMGFPGVGWLFAGFPLAASILLMAGPALTWAVIPIAFSPYAHGPLRAVGWKAELVWLPLSALLSSAFLYRAHARRRRALEGTPPRSGPLDLSRNGRRRNGAHPNGHRSGYRTRVVVALGVIVLILVSLPFLPALAGIGSSSVRYSYQRFTPEVTGQFLATGHGAVKLFAWSDPQSDYPQDALRVHAIEVRSLVVRAPAVDNPSAYQLFDLGRGASVPIAVQARTPTTLTLVPMQRLAPGRYAFVASHEGMFGGRDYDYLTVVPPGAPVTRISDGARGTAPQIADALLPLVAALLALVFAGRLAVSAFRRPAGQKVLWALGFGLFAAAAAAEAVAHRSGWDPALFRIYYLAGGVLTVAYLGAGAAWLLLPRRRRDVMVGALVAASFAAAAAVLLAPVDTAALAGAGSARPPSNHALLGHAYLWAIALNSFGTIFLIGGSLYSIVRGRRVRTNLWIAAGAIVVALSTGLSRGGTYSFVYAGELVGVALMFYGFTFTSRPPRAAALRPEPTGSVAPVG